MRCSWALLVCALWIPTSAWIGREIDGLVYTVEEVDLLRLEKHISVWKVDLEESRGGNRKLEMLLAQRLMRESVLLMKTLRAYASGDESRERGEREPVMSQRRVPPPQVKEPSSASRKLKREGSGKVEKGFWAGEGVEVEENSVKRVK
jgi:hypothetical protein